MKRFEVRFYGAAGEVTGSCHWLRLGDYQVLLDCGMIQGSRAAEERNDDPFPFDPSAIDAVVLSHAHIDHSGRLPLLVSRGFNGSIHCQNATRSISGILLEDSAHIASMEAERTNRRRQREGLGNIDPLYTDRDVKQTMQQFVGHVYNHWVEVVPGLRIRFLDAGHIMGSTVVEAEIELDSGTRRLVFSGDLGQYDTPILRDPVSPESADMVVMESTYGSRHHRDRNATIDEIGTIIQAANRHKGNILIPAFSVGRTQEMLFHFGKNYDEWELDNWRIVLDSPLAIKASKIYWDYTHLYDEEATEMLRAREMPPLPNLHLSRSREDSQQLNKHDSGLIILAGSGMCTGGRIVHHLRHNLWQRHAHVIIVGYQAQGSLGRKLVDGFDYVRIHRDNVRVNASIHTVGGLSAHADQGDLLHWYGKIENRPPVYLVHGETGSARVLARELEQSGAPSATVASPGLVVDLKTMRSFMSD